MDFSAAVQFAFQDKDWWKKCLVAGLYTFIPIIGMIAVMGWQRRIFDQIREGHPVPLPDVRFSEDLSYGLTPFIAMMNTGIIILVLWFGMAILGGVAGAIDETLGGVMMIFGGLCVSLVAMVLSLLFPDFLRRAFVENERFPLFKPGPSMKAIKEDFGGYLMLYLGIYLANFLGGLGGLACGVGAVLTTPLGMAMMMHFLAQYTAKVESRKSSFQGYPG